MPLAPHLAMSLSEPPGKLVDIGGRTLHACVCGSGPPVVLNSGGGNPGVGFYPTIEQRLARFATVVTYDRAGIGRSAAPHDFQTAADMVADLQALLSKLDVRLPAVLVGYSFSALVAQLYACLHPSQVSGLLLLDPTPDAPFAGFHKMPSDIQTAMREAQLQHMRASKASDELLRDMYRIPESCEQVYRAIEEEHRMPDIPVVVVTASLPPDALGKKGQYQMGQSHKRIVERVARGRHLFAARRSHTSLVTEETDLIVDTIRSLLGPAA